MYPVWFLHSLFCFMIVVLCCWGWERKDCWICSGQNVSYCSFLMPSSGRQNLKVDSVGGQSLFIRCLDVYQLVGWLTNLNMSISQGRRTWWGSPRTHHFLGMNLKLTMITFNFFFRNVACFHAHKLFLAVASLWAREKWHLEIFLWLQAIVNGKKVKKNSLYLFCRL